MQLSPSASDSTSTEGSSTEGSSTEGSSTEGSIVRYRVGLNTVQQDIRDRVAALSHNEVHAFANAFCAEVTQGLLVPIFPTPGSVADIVTPPSLALFTPNDLVEHAGLHVDTVDKYLHNYIGVLRDTPDHKEGRMTREHSDAPWGMDYASYLTEPLPLRLVSARALVFIVMAPASIYRPTTGDEELVARWQRLVQFRASAPARFGVPKGAPKRIDATVETVTSVRRTPHTKTKPSEDTPMPIPPPLLLPTAAELDAALTDPVPAAPVKEVAGVHPIPMMKGLDLDPYLAAIVDLRARAEQLRGLLDLLPAQEVESRVADFFRAGLDTLDNGPR